MEYKVYRLKKLSAFNDYRAELREDDVQEAINAGLSMKIICEGENNDVMILTPEQLGKWETRKYMPKEKTPKKDKGYWLLGYKWVPIVDKH